MLRSAVRTIVYGDTAELGHAADVLCASERFSLSEIRCVDSWTKLYQELEQFRPELLVVLAGGAAGMEGVFLARQMYPQLPVFWFSDDSQFGMQSHRLDCSYFSTKPLNDEKLRKALEHCQKLCIRL